MYDLEDPARPRFTLAELKDILQERNSLKVGRLPVCNLFSVTLFTPDKQIKEIIISSPGYHRNKKASMGWSFSSKGFILSPEIFCTIYSSFTKHEACIWWAIFWQFSLTTRIQTCKLSKQKLHLIQSAQTIRRNLQIIKINHNGLLPSPHTARMNCRIIFTAPILGPSERPGGRAGAVPPQHKVSTCLSPAAAAGDMRWQGHWCCSIVIMKVPSVILCQLPLLLLNDLFAWHHTMKI